MPWTDSPIEDPSPRRTSPLDPDSTCERVLERIKSLIPKKKDLPEDYHYNVDSHHGIAQRYLDCTHFARQLVQSDNFNFSIIFVIILAGINVGVQSYEEMTDVYILNVFDFLILIVFSFEVVVKILAEGLAPWLYFTGKEWKWNVFDFGIVFMSLPLWDGLFGGASLALLRLVRLMRLAKLIKKIPQLQMIVDGLVGGLSSIAYILLLLVLVFYLFAVAGYYLFHDNDPFHFKTLPIAMVTLFRCATLDAWSDVMYLNNFGCNGFDYLYVSDEDRSSGNRLFWCVNPRAQYILSSVYFIVFVVIAALVMLSLFIGAVALSMNDSLDKLKQLAAEAARAERMKQITRRKNLASARMEVSNAGSSDISLRISPKLKFSNNESTTPDSITPIACPQTPYTIAPGPRASDSPPVVRKAWSNLGVVMERVPDDKEPGMSALEQKGPMQMNSETHSSITSSGITLTDNRYHRNFSMFMPAVLKNALNQSNLQHSVNESSEIDRKLRVALGELPESVDYIPKSMSSFISRIRSAQSFREQHSILAEYCKFIAEHSQFVGMVTIVICLAGVNVGAQTDPRITAVPECRAIMNILDVTILAVFSCECVIKILGEGSKPWTYFVDNWNKFDFIIVVGSYAPGAGSLLTILRLLRLLRVLKLVKSLPQLTVIVNALLMGMSSIGYIGLILFLCFYVFAILGMILFRENDPFHFGNLHISMFTLFRSSTLDDWSEILYVNMYGCDQYPGV